MNLQIRDYIQFVSFPFCLSTNYNFFEGDIMKFLLHMNLTRGGVLSCEKRIQKMTENHNYIP